MATIDSGTETLFSDDSSCELIGSPSYCDDDTGRNFDDRHSDANRIAPPNIQPYSGVLEKGKIVIRPIAFKPAMSPAARFGLAGERYGSTPILTRPGSRLTLYGSTSDLRQPHGISSNYSLDRKLRSSCPSDASSPPLAMSSLTSLPHKLVNYDSLESVRKSPMSNADSIMMNNKTSYRLSSRAGGGSLLDLTPSPSDSGVSELEAALRDRDSELAYLRQTMEHNEQVIFRVYQDKEKVWERELRRLKSVHEQRLRATAQKTLKLEQMLMMQTYQLQQEKKRMLAEQQRSNYQTERLKQEMETLQNRLEETEWSLCQKTGEIALMKSQLKDYQNDEQTKCHELAQLRNEQKEAKDRLEKTESDREQYKALLEHQTHEMEARLADEVGGKERLEAEVRELRTELSDLSLSEYGGVGAGRRAGPACACAELGEIHAAFERKTRDFEQERVVWAQEKEKVLRYQRQLQMNYVQMYRRTRALEKEVESLTIELELDKSGVKKMTSSTIEL